MRFNTQTIAHKFPTLIIAIVLLTIPFVKLEALITPHFLPRVTLLFLSTLSLLAFFILTSLKRKQVTLTISSVHISLILFNLTAYLSLLAKTPNRIESFTTDILPLTLSTLSLFLITQFPRLSYRFIICILVLTSTMFSLLSMIYQALVSSTTTPLLFSNLTPITQLSLVSLGTVTLTYSLFKRFSEPQNQSKWIKTLLNILLVILHLVGVALLIPRLSTFTSPASISWAVMLESLKKSPFLGFGPGNYSQAYTIYQPLPLSTTTLYSSNSFFQYATTSGLLALAALAGLFVVCAYALARTFSTHLLSNLLATTTLLFLAISPDAIHLFLLAIFLSYPHLHLKSLQLHISLSPRPLLILILATLIPSIYITHLLYITISADIAAKSATLAYNRGRVLDAHLAYTKAVETNPHIDSYRISLANTSITIAEELAKKKDLSEPEKARVTQLIEQSITQAKQATHLNPLKSSNWHALSRIYIRLIPVSADAPGWAQTSLLKAVTLEPLNYTLHFELASLYYNTGLLDQAENQFKSSITLNPAHTNSYYNLAHLYLTRKRPDLALLLLQKTLSLLSPNSSDWDAINRELTTLKPRPSQTDSALSLPENVPTGTPLILNQSNAPDL